MSQLVRRRTVDIPLPSQQPLSVDFLQHRTTLFRDLNVPTNTYRSDLNGFSPEALSGHDAAEIARIEQALIQAQKMMAKVTNKFEESLSQAQKASGRSDAMAIDIRKGSDRDRIGQVLQQARDRLEKPDSTGKRLVARFKKAIDGSDWLLPFLKLLPDGQYKTLSGGLELIVTMMMQYSDVRGKIGQIIEAFPDDLANAQYGDLYRGDKRVKLRITQLSIAAIRALQYVVDWHSEKSSSTLRKVVTKASKYSQDIDLRITEISQAKIKLKDELDSCLHRSNWRQEFVGIDSNLRIREGVQVAYETNSQLRELSDKTEEKFQILNNTLSMLNETIKKAAWDKSQWEAKEQRHHEKTKYLESTRPAHFTIRDFRKRSGLDQDNSDTRALGNVSSIGVTSGIKFHRRVEQLASLQQYRQWLGDSDSSLLIVNGEGGELEGVSPVSFLLGLTIDQLKKQPDRIVLSFFCGLDSPGKSRNPIPNMIKELLQQFLAQCDADDVQDVYGGSKLRFLTEDRLENVRQGSLNGCLRTLDNLLEVFISESKATFIFIDGVEFFESRWNEDMQFVYRKLLDFVRASRSRGDRRPLKVMISASTFSKIAVRDRQCLDMIDMREVDGMDEVDGLVLEGLDIVEF